MTSTCLSDILPTIPSFCSAQRQINVFTCKMIETTKKQKIVLNLTARERRPINKPEHRTCLRSTSKVFFNIFSFVFAILVFLTLVHDADAEYLCGSQLVDALRYICGRRGIFVPSHSRTNRGHHGRHRSGGQRMPITYRCCQLGCTYSQLKNYCAPKRRTIASTRHHQHRELTPPSIVTVSTIPPTTTQTTFVSTVPTSTTSSTQAIANLRRKRPSFKELEDRFESILQNKDPSQSALVRAGRGNNSQSLANQISVTLKTKQSESTQATTRPGVIQAILSRSKISH